MRKPWLERIDRVGVAVLLVSGALALLAFWIASRQATYYVQGAYANAAIVSVIATGLVVLYFLPWLIAATRENQNEGAIAVVNVFLGWTFIGWVVALAMAFGGASADRTPMTRPCPRCAEQIQKAAQVCRFCGAEVSGAPATT